MSDFPNDLETTLKKTDNVFDRRRVLREIVRTGKYAAPMATVLLMSTKSAVAVGSNPDV